MNSFSSSNGGNVNYCSLSRRLWQYVTTALINPIFPLLKIHTKEKIRDSIMLCVYRPFVILHLFPKESKLCYILFMGYFLVIQMILNNFMIQLYNLLIYN